MALLFCSISLLSVAGGLRDTYRDVPPESVGNYFLMQNMLIGSMLALVYTNDIFTAFVFIEIVTIAVCSLVAAKPGGVTLGHTMTYLIISLVSSCLVLLSIALLYSVSGHLLMPNILEVVRNLAANGEYTMPLFVLIGLMTAGLAIKCALFPFHGWLPGIYTSATTSVSAVLAGIVGKCYLLLLIKFEYRVFGPEVMGLLRISHILLVLGVVAIVYGAWKAIRQSNIKRMLSYSSISQVGLAFAAAGLNTEAGMAAACFNIASHATGKAMLFTAAGGLAAVSGHRNDYNSLRGAARRDPLAGAAFIIGALSMIGFPFFPGFAAKLYIAIASLETPFAILVIPPVVVISMLLAAIYFVPAITCIFVKPESPGPENPERIPMPFMYRASLIAFIAITFYLGLFSQQVLSVIEQGLAVLG